MDSFTIGRYRGRWAVLDTRAHVWYFIGAGKRYCQRRAAELNKGQ